MNSSQHNTEEYIELYLDDKLSPEELSIFLERMESDADFAEEVRLQKLITQSTHYYRQIYLRELLQKEVRLREQKKSRRRVYISLSIAASIILLLSAGYWGGQYYYQNDRIVATNILGDNDEELKRGASNNIEPGDKYNLGIKAYREQEYERAIELLLAAPDSTKEHVRFNLFLAKALLQSKQYQKAIYYLTQINKKGEFFEQRQWHLALAYLGVGREDKARTELSLIVEEEWTYHEKATRLLKQLDSPLRKFFH